MNNKEIKFRIWVPAYAEMFYSQGKSHNVFSGTDEYWYLLPNGEKRGVFTTWGDVETKNDAIWQQFTGLKDIHGKEIYEGDIITYTEKTHEHGDSTQQRGQIIYDENKASFAIAGEKTGEVWNYFTDYGLSKFEVVGSIFEGAKS